MSWRTNASRSAGVSDSMTTKSAMPDRVGEQRLVLGVELALGRDQRLGHADQRLLGA